MFQTSESCIKLHAVAELLLSEQCPLLHVCVHLDGSNADNYFSNTDIIIFFFTKPISDYGKMLKYRGKIGTPICQSISCCLCLLLTERGHFNIPVLLHAL